MRVLPIICSLALAAQAVLGEPATESRPAATRPASQALPNPFFALDTATKDANHQTYDAQVGVLKELGYAGWAPAGTENVPEMLKALDAQGLKMFALYVGINVDPDQPKYDPKLPAIIAALKGRGTILWVFVLSKQRKPSSTGGDDRAVAILRELADMAEPAGVRIAIYPHVRFYVERVEDAVRVADKVDRRSVGVTFNLCHWLSVDRGKNLEPLIELAMPRLFVVTINGADRDGTGWDRLIQPLGRGDYDVCNLLRLLRRHGYAGPIGFQGYGIKGSVRENLRITMDAWRRYAEDCRGDGLAIHLRAVNVCDTFAGGYQVAAADVNGDGKLDILALGENAGSVDWFENPGSDQAPWVRRTISGTSTQRNIDLAVNDIDGDGRLDVAVASDFYFSQSDRGGTVSWFRRPAIDAAPWTAAAIHAEPTAHRIRWADVDGDRRKELITAPIVGRGAKPPGLQEAPARLMCQWVPKDPVHDAWPEQIIDQTLTVVHGLFVIDWDGDGRDELLTASNQGIHLFKAEGGQPAMRWSRTQLAAGHAGEPPNRGSSEVGVGQDRRGARFLATIEPWHGHEVVVYTPPPGGAGDAAAWQRHVIDDSLRAGHALCCVDLDRDGGDEIVAGYRGEGTSLYGYRRVAADPPRWERFIIDASGIAAQGCVAADVNGDGWLDLVATGGTTHNVRLYLNETQRRP